MTPLKIAHAPRYRPYGCKALKPRTLASDIVISGSKAVVGGARSFVVPTIVGDAGAEAAEAREMLAGIDSSALVGLHARG